MANLQNNNAPNPQTFDNKNEGGKVVDTKAEGGTQGSKNTSPELDQNKVGPSALSSPSKSEAEKAEDKLFRKVDEKDGVKTIVSSVSEDAAKEAEAKQANAPEAINETQRLEGSSYVNITQNGRLAGDRSVRDDRPLDKIKQEIEDKAGPNPTPLREGNERTKMELGLAGTGGTNLVRDIDQQTSRMADELSAIRKKGTLTNEDKDRLEQMEQQLRETGRF